MVNSQQSKVKSPKIKSQRRDAENAEERRDETSAIRRAAQKKLGISTTENTEGSDEGAEIAARFD
jgi:hypothetical protein